LFLSSSSPSPCLGFNPSPAALDTRSLHPGNKSPPSQLTHILIAEDTRISQDTSADATKRATSKIPSVHVAHVVHGPLQVWITSMLGRDFTVYGTYQPEALIRTLLLSPFCLRLPALHFTLSPFTLATFHLIIVALRSHLHSHFPPLPPPLTSRVGYLFLLAYINPLAWACQRKRGNRGN